MALLIKLPTVPPRKLFYHSWIISPPLRPSCVILLHLPAGTLCWLPQTGHKSRCFSIDSNLDYLCAGDSLEDYLKEQLHYWSLCCLFYIELCSYWSRSLDTKFILGVTKYANLIGSLCESISLRITPFST